MDLVTVLNSHPSDCFHSYENVSASENDEEQASSMASGIRLDGRKLAIMRKVEGLSYPQAAARARVPVAAIQAVEDGRTINTGALLRLLQVYEPKEDPVEVMPKIIVRRSQMRV